MASNNYRASIDIGTETIALLIADKEDGDNLRIIGHNVCPSIGVKKGSLFSVDSLSRVINKLIDETYESFGLVFDNVRVNISDTHLTCTDGKGKVSIEEAVTSKDLDSVLESAMAAEVLESKVHIVTVSSSSIRNIERCLEQCEVALDKIVLNPIAKSQAVLTQEDSDNGVCLVDIGAGVTSYSVFHEEGIVRSGVIAMGGDDVTNDIANAFDTSLEEAKRLKENYGVAKSSTLKEDKFIRFTNNKEEHHLSSLELSEVIEEAYCNIFEILKNELKHHNLERILKSGFVLCGGAAEINSIEELVRNFFSKRVKMGKIQRLRLSGLESILTDYRYAGAIGLLLHDGDLNKAEYVESIHKKGVIGKLKKVIVGNF